MRATTAATVNGVAALGHNVRAAHGRYAEYPAQTAKSST